MRLGNRLARGPEELPSSASIRKPGCRNSVVPAFNRLSFDIRVPTAGASYRVSLWLKGGGTAPACPRRPAELAAVLVHKNARTRARGAQHMEPQKRAAHGSGGSASDASACGGPTGESERDTSGTLRHHFRSNLVLPGGNRVSRAASRKPASTNDRTLLRVTEGDGAPAAQPL